MVFARKQIDVPVSRVPLAWLSKVLSNATNEIGHFRKTIDYE